MGNSYESSAMQSNIKFFSDLASGAAKAAAARKEARIIAFMLRLSDELGQVRYVYTPYNTQIPISPIALGVIVNMLRLCQISNLFLYQIQRTFKH